MLKQNKDWFNKEKWTILRKAQYSYFQNKLPKHNDKSALLDIGAGAGQFHDLYKGYSITAIDFQAFPAVTHVHDMEKPLPFSDNSFDVVTSSNTFEHMHDYRGLIRESYRVLKPGGIFIASTPFMLGIHQAPHDYFRFTEFELKRTLHELGFCDSEVIALCTAFDSFAVSRQHFFMQLFDVTQNKIFLHLLVKFVWNLNKLLDIILKPTYRLNISSTEALGYGFFGKKPMSR